MLLICSQHERNETRRTVAAWVTRDGSLPSARQCSALIRIELNYKRWWTSQARSAIPRRLSVKSSCSDLQTAQRLLLAARRFDSRTHNDEPAPALSLGGRSMRRDTPTPWPRTGTATSVGPMDRLPLGKDQSTASRGRDVVTSMSNIAWLTYAMSQFNYIRLTVTDHNDSVTRSINVSTVIRIKQSYLLLIVIAQRSTMLVAIYYFSQDRSQFFNRLYSLTSLKSWL